ncbi:hypothetical protein Cst_c25960 [Thermoclostridium stercorarium subsp. stercorarium DSM 8532]|uniref:Uncharacterized protein n=1 Tax=Thermoclostridium stercorarium (strain ATCC 35414 / DSM 8532 / NCIMB 11754) TaxID=1121335 RepID=L7VT48_THES1|nr:hypothetical protein Cst_c25960 [Thermoclostridium stercorarium subsp. stercorarium DSM 8532]
MEIAVSTLFNYGTIRPAATAKQNSINFRDCSVAMHKNASQGNNH